MLTRIQVGIIAVLVGAFIVATCWVAFQMMMLGDWLIFTMGVGLVFLSALGAWSLYAELNLALQVGRLVARLQKEGTKTSTEALAELPRFGAEKSARIALRKPWQKRADEDPQSWQNQLQLGLILGETGDKNLGRKHLREAVRLSK